MPLPIVISIALLLLVPVSFTSSTVRSHPHAKIVAGLVGLGAIYVATYSLGYQSGRDRALRDNRADARAAAEAAASSAADTAAGSASR